MYAPATTPPGIDVVFQQYRSDEVDQIVRAEIHNGGSVPHTLDTLQLEWVGLAVVDPTVAAYTVHPGQTVTLALDYGEAMCSEPPRFDEPPLGGPIVLHVGRAGVVEQWHANDPRGVLERLHQLGCRVQAVEQHARIEFGDRWSPTEASGQIMSGELVVRRVSGDEPVSIDAVDGSVLIELSRASGPVEMAPEVEFIVAPVQAMSSGNCAAHALADSKKTFEFQVALTVGATPVSVSVTAPDAVRGALYSTVTAGCGLR